MKKVDEDEVFRRGCDFLALICINALMQNRLTALVSHLNVLVCEQPHHLTFTKLRTASRLM